MHSSQSLSNSHSKKQNIPGLTGNKLLALLHEQSNRKHEHIQMHRKKYRDFNEQIAGNLSSLKDEEKRILEKYSEKVDIFINMNQYGGSDNWGSCAQEASEKQEDLRILQIEQQAIRIEREIIKIQSEYRNLSRRPQPVTNMKTPFDPINLQQIEGELDCQLSDMKRALESSLLQYEGTQQQMIEQLQRTIEARIESMGAVAQRI